MKEHANKRVTAEIKGRENGFLIVRPSATNS
jgi:hypothetical protein